MLEIRKFGIELDWKRFVRAAVVSLALSLGVLAFDFLHFSAQKFFWQVEGDWSPRYVTMIIVIITVLAVLQSSVNGWRFFFVLLPEEWGDKEEGDVVASAITGVWMFFAVMALALCSALVVAQTSGSGILCTIFTALWILFFEFLGVAGGGHIRQESNQSRKAWLLVGSAIVILVFLDALVILTPLMRTAQEILGRPVWQPWPPLLLALATVGVFVTGRGAVLVWNNLDNILDRMFSTDAPPLVQSAPQMPKSAASPITLAPLEFRFVHGDDDFDRVMDITNGTRIYGEAGLAIAGVLDEATPKKVGALEFWTFNRFDVRTSTVVLVSEAAYQDSQQVAEYSERGEVLPAHEGVEVTFNFTDYMAVATVRSVKYVVDPAFLPDSYFQEVVVELHVSLKEEGGTR